MDGNIIGNNNIIGYFMENTRTLIVDTSIAIIGCPFVKYISP